MFGLLVAFLAIYAEPTFAGLGCGNTEILIKENSTRIITFGMELYQGLEYERGLCEWNVTSELGYFWVLAYQIYGFTDGCASDHLRVEGINGGNVVFDETICGGHMEKYLVPAEHGRIVFKVNRVIPFYLRYVDIRVQGCSSGAVDNIFHYARDGKAGRFCESPYIPNPYRESIFACKEYPLAYSLCRIVVPCETPKIENSILEGTNGTYPNGKTLQVECTEGSLPEGDERITCRQGTWVSNTSFPKCIPDTCDQYPISNGIVTPVGNLTGRRYQGGSKITIKCTCGYQLVGDREIICRDRKWTSVGHFPTCIPENCVELQFEDQTETQEGTYSNASTSHTVDERPHYVPVYGGYQELKLNNTIVD